MIRFAGVTLFLVIFSSNARAGEFLAPVLTLDTPGAYGSVWRAELAIVNSGDAPTSISPFNQDCPVLCPPAYYLYPHRTELDPPVDRASPGETPGRILEVGDVGTTVSFHLRLYDTSRTALRLGTEIPVVPSTAFTSGPIQLPDIPIVAGYRYMLRVYSMDQAHPGTANVRAFAPVPTPTEAPDVVITAFDLPLTPALSWLEPSYAQFSSIREVLGEAGAPTIRLEITQKDANGAPLWAFVTVTNDDTQEFFIVVPQPR